MHIKMQSDGTHHRNGPGKGAVVELCPEEIYDEWGQRGKQSAQGKTQAKEVIMNSFKAILQLSYDLMGNDSIISHQRPADRSEVSGPRFYLILVGLWVLHSLEAYRHDNQRRRRQVFNYWDQVNLLSNSLHLRPANRMTAQLWRAQWEWTQLMIKASRQLSRFT